MMLHRAISRMASLPLIALAVPGLLGAQGGEKVAGNVAILEKSGKRSADLAHAVVWLEGRNAPAARPSRRDIQTETKQFLPRVLVVPVGSTVGFPNHDPFNHNVFSISDDAAFDLGLYGRGETRVTEVRRAGIVRVYCNVHPRMSAFLVVRDNALFTQPAADGSWVVSDVPAGEYTLRVWHERGGESSRVVTVPPGGLDGVTLQLDARGYSYKPHLNKFGKPYDPEGRRY
jgi:plastocyanin